MCHKKWGKLNIHTWLMITTNTSRLKKLKEPLPSTVLELSKPHIDTFFILQVVRQSSHWFSLSQQDVACFNIFLLLAWEHKISIFKSLVSIFPSHHQRNDSPAMFGRTWRSGKRVKNYLLIGFSLVLAAISSWSYYHNFSSVKTITTITSIFRYRVTITSIWYRLT